jgi:small subunit ribosomal protein S9
MSSSSKTKYNNNNTFDEDEDGDDEEEDDEEDEDDSDDEDVEEEWDEEKYGAANTKHWQGFDGDLDAITDEGVPTWLQSVRTLNAIDEEKRMRAKLARRAAEEAKMNIVRVRKVDEFGRAYGTGRRKTSTARVWIKEAGTPFGGRVIVNKKDFVEYFARDTYREDILKPFSVLNKMGHFDVWCTVKGGGLTGQSGAIRHGISRALQHFNPDFRGPLKKEGFLTRDPRMVERKKPGQPKARKKFQWVKR